MAESYIRHNPSSGSIGYDPLPLQGDNGQLGAPYSTGPHEESSYNMEEIPSGAGRPRFQGSYRDSYASSDANLGGGGIASTNSSAYHLAPGGRDSSYSAAAGGYRDDPHAPGSPTNAGFLSDKSRAYGSPRAKKRKTGLILAALAVLALVIAAVVVPVYFFVIKPKSNKNVSSSDPKDSSTSTSGAASPTGSPGARNVVSGGDGSTVTKDDGSTFVYKNSFGGTWYWDPNDPFHNGARAQSWSPALNETFKYGSDVIRGVNIGGWLVTEPFISPALYEKYNPGTTSTVIDEWTLSVAMRADSASGGINQMEDHYKTFITEDDIAAIAAAGLNWVRIPIGWWAIETRGNEPYLAKTSWTYLLKAIGWCRKYGIRINLDFHALPGSQNGWNHSGRLGTINMLNGPMGLANAQRSLDYIRIFAEFISQPEYKDVVAMFGIMNEPQASVVGQDALSRFYLQAYNIVRTAGGTGEGNGPFVSFHDGFLGQTQWANFLPNADRIALDIHPYLCFQQQSAAPLSTFIETPCGAWAPGMNTSMSAFGLSAAGEFSNAINDCGLFLNGVGLGNRFDGTFAGSTATGSCTAYLDWQNWDATTKQQYMQFAMHSMDALQNFFFWTWKIGNSSASGTVMTPQWSYSLGLENGWMPPDPRAAIGACGGGSPFNGPLQPYQTGGAGAGQIPAAVSASLAWPPPSISGGGAAAALPTYTPTGSVPTLSGPTFTITSGNSKSTANAGNGWANSADNAGLMTDAAGCSYLDPWVGSGAPPAPLCTAGTTAAASKRAAVPEPMLTAVPIRV